MVKMNDFFSLYVHISRYFANLAKFCAVLSEGSGTAESVAGTCKFVMAPLAVECCASLLVQFYIKS